MKEPNTYRTNKGKNMALAWPYTINQKVQQKDKHWTGTLSVYKEEV